MENKVIDYLLEQGIKPNLKGFNYLVQAVVAVMKDRSQSEHMTMLYHKLAKDNNTSYINVERNIRYVITSAGINQTCGEFVLRSAIKISRK